MLGINHDSYNVVMWVLAQIFEPLNNWWLNRKTRDSLPCTSDNVVSEIRKTSLLPNIRDDAINSLFDMSQSFDELREEHPTIQQPFTEASTISILRMILVCSVHNT
jgi:hypothetical protein